MIKQIVSKSLNILLGILFGIMLHYLLFRFSLPVKPFIYVSF